MTEANLKSLVSSNKDPTKCSKKYLSEGHGGIMLIFKNPSQNFENDSVEVFKSLKNIWNEKDKRRLIL